MKELGIPQNEIEYAMSYGVYDLLTVISKDELTKGVHFVRTMIADKLGEMKNIDEEDGEWVVSDTSYKRWDKFFDEYFNM